MPINLDFKKKVILVLIIFVEIVIGSIFLFNFYQKKIVHKSQDSDKIAVIKKENLIFPEESEFKHYYEFKPNYTETDSPDWLGYEAKYNINADGLNDRFDYSIEKPEDVYRIITLGDSFTYGHYINTEDNWTEQLENILNASLNNRCSIKKFEVINLGMAGWDIPYIVKRYRDIGAKYNPDLIIWLESGTGFTRLNEIMSEKISVCEMDEEIIDILNFPTKSHYCWQMAQEEIDKEYPYEEIEQVTTSQLDSFFSFSSQEKTLFFTFEDSSLNEKWRKTLEKWRKRYPNAIFSSTVPEVYRLKQVLPDGHPDKNGHKTIANSIYKYLENTLFNNEAL